MELQEEMQIAREKIEERKGNDSRAHGSVRLRTSALMIGEVKAHEHILMLISFSCRFLQLIAIKFVEFKYLLPVDTSKNCIWCSQRLLKTGHTSCGHCSRFVIRTPKLRLGAA